MCVRSEFVWYVCMSWGTYLIHSWSIESLRQATPLFSDDLDKLMMVATGTLVQVLQTRRLVQTVST